MKGYFHLHPPKTGGSSIISALLEHSSAFRETYGRFYKSGRLGHHYSPRTIPADIGSTVTLGIRNPYDRMLSMTRWMNSRGIYNNYFTINVHIKAAKRYKKLQWEDSTAVLHASLQWAANSTLTEWESAVSNECEVKLIRFENLIEDFQAIYPVSLLHVNQVLEPMSMDHILENFNSQETLNKFNDMYSADFEKYAYTLIEDINDLYNRYSTNT